MYLRKLLLAATAAFSLILPLTNETSVQAHPNVNHPQHRIYWVYYRSCPDVAWVCYGGYYHVSEAAQAVNYYRYKGYESYYR